VKKFVFSTLFFVWKDGRYETQILVNNQPGLEQKIPRSKHKNLKIRNPTEKPNITMRKDGYIFLKPLPAI